MNTNIEELASLYVLDKLTPKERRAFEERLEADTELVILVRELEAAFEEQITSLPQRKVPDNVFHKIEGRIQSQAPASIQSPVITLPISTFIGWGMAAALLLGVGITLFVTSRNSFNGVANNQPVVLVVGMNSGSSVLERLPSVLPIDESENFVQLAQMAENFWQHPEQLPANITKSPLANTLGSGYAVYDPQSKHGFIAIQKLPAQKAGKNYFLWLRDTKSNVLECAGIVPMREKDQGLYFFELDDDSPISGSLVAFFITEEDTSEQRLSQPKGELVLGSDHI